MYKLSSTNQWKYIDLNDPNDPWNNLATNSELQDSNGTITFSFTIASEELDQCTFDIEIWNSYIEFNPNPVKATQYNINYGGCKLNLIVLFASEFTIGIIVVHENIKFLKIILG